MFCKWSTFLFISLGSKFFFHYILMLIGLHSQKVILVGMCVFTLNIKRQAMNISYLIIENNFELSMPTI